MLPAVVLRQRHKPAKKTSDQVDEIVEEYKALGILENARASKKPESPSSECPAAEPPAPARTDALNETGPSSSSRTSRLSKENRFYLLGTPIPEREITLFLRTTLRLGLQHPHQSGANLAGASDEVQSRECL